MEKRKKTNNNWKIPIVIFVIFLFLILVLYARLFQVSVFAEIGNINMAEFAKQRNTENRKLPATRGKIYDKDGNVLALNVPSYTVIAFLDESRTTNPDIPYHVVDKENTAKELAPILNMEEEYLLELLSKKLYQVELGPGGRGISELKKDEVADLNLPGIAFLEKHKRFYPNGDFASYVIGYAKTYENVEEEGKQINYDIEGELGIEINYNDKLKGTDGKLIFQKDRHGYKIPDTKEERVEAINGNDIYLTLDSTIQRFIETEVKDTYDKYDPTWIQLTVMDAKTGKILGSSTAPSFDPNIRNIENYENNLVSNAFEPGSTMKVFTYMCAIDKGTYKGDDTYETGRMQIGANVVSDWNKIGWGKLNYDKAFEYSSNVGIANLVKKYLTKQDLLDCFERYGFGQKTNIQLPREATGQLKFNYEIEVAAAGYGQGITTTAIQHLQGLTIIANNGTMLKPQIVDKIINPNDKEIIYESKIEKVENVVSNETATKMKALMYNVVNSDDDLRTGRPYYIEGFDILGKTGTAQIFSNGSYLKGYNDYIYSFSGMYPADDPEIIVYAAIKQPESDHGTTILSGAMKSLLKNIAKYKNMFDTRKEDLTIMSYDVESYINKEVEVVKQQLKDKKIKPIIIGNGNIIINQYPQWNNKILTYEKVFLKTNDKTIILPNLIGYSRNEVHHYCQMANLQCEFEGYGFVNEQGIKEGTTIEQDDILILTLKQKFNLSPPIEEDDDISD